jgi:hypothetical protein
MYYGSDGTLLQSRDVNAPLPPFYLARSDQSFGVIRQIDSSARQRSDSLQVMVRGRFNRYFNGQAQYSLTRATNNSGGLNWFPANDYDLASEWARADFDRRHRLQVLGAVDPGRKIAIGVALTVQSGLPYSELLGTDAYNNGRGTARPPGITRNTLQGPGQAQLDARVSREFAFDKRHPSRTIALGLDAFNLLNAVNYLSYVGTISSPLFGQPVNAQAPRELQLSARVKF